MDNPFIQLTEVLHAPAPQPSRIERIVKNKEQPSMPEETISIEETLKCQTEEVLEQLKKGKALHDSFAKQFNEEYLVAGKLMTEWRDHFKLQIPPDLNPKVCQDLAVKLMELHQEASFLKAVCDARMRACLGASNIRYRSEFTELVAEYRQRKEKLPAKDTLAQLAERKVGDMKDAVAHAEIELSFWKEILNDLSNCRKLLENATINISVEMKTLQFHSYPKDND